MIPVTIGHMGRGRGHPRVMAGFAGGAGEEAGGRAGALLA